MAWMIWEACMLLGVIPLWSSWQDHGKILWSCARQHLGVPGGSQVVWWLEFCNDIFTLQNVFDQFLVVLKGIISVALMEECFSFLKECQTKENLSLSQIINCIGTLLLEGFTNAYYNLSQRITWIGTLVLEGFTLHHHSTAYFNLSQTINWIGTLLLEGFTNAYYNLWQIINWIGTFLLEGFTLLHQSIAYYDLSQTINWIGTLLLECFTLLHQSNAYHKEGLQSFTPLKSHLFDFSCHWIYLISLQSTQ